MKHPTLPMAIHLQNRVTQTIKTLGYLLLLCLIGYLLLAGTREYQRVKFQVFEYSRSLVTSAEKFQDLLLIQRELTRFVAGLQEKENIKVSLRIIINNSKVAEVGPIEPGIFRVSASVEFRTSSGNPVFVEADFDYLPFIKVTLFSLALMWALFWLVLRISRLRLEKELASVTKTLTTTIAHIQKTASNINDEATVKTNLKGNTTITEVNDLTESITTFLNVVSKYNAEKEELSLAEGRLQMARQVAHDIRSPISALNIAICPSVIHKQEAQELVKNALIRINGIADDLLKFSKQTKVADASNESKRKMVCCLENTVEKLVKEKSLEYRDKGISISINKRSNASNTITNASEIEISRILSNIINNSVEAIESNGSIDVAILQEKKTAKLTVSDSGKGMDSRVIEKIGTMGFSTKIGENSGSGLGLYHAKTYLESIGGKLSVTSVLNKGTQVHIELPISL